MSQSYKLSTSELTAALQRHTRKLAGLLSLLFCLLIIWLLLPSSQGTGTVQPVPYKAADWAEPLPTNVKPNAALEELLDRYKQRHEKARSSQENSQKDQYLITNKNNLGWGNKFSEIITRFLMALVTDRLFFIVGTSSEIYTFFDSKLNLDWEPHEK
jgi:hypothetical protein